MSDDTWHAAIADEQVGATTHHHERDVFVEAHLDQVREAFFSLWFGPELRGSADSQSGMARERLVEPNATGSHGSEQAVAQGEVGDQPVGGFVDISSAEAQDQVAIFDFRSRALMNLPKIGSKFDVLMAMRADRLNDHLAGDARNWLFAGWINIRNEGEVGASKRPAEFFLECQSARIAVRLKHDEHPFPMTGSAVAMVAAISVG